MTVYINRSEYGYNGALPGRTITTDDKDYGAILLARGFEILEAEKTETEKEAKKIPIKKIVPKNSQ